MTRHSRGASLFMSGIPADLRLALRRLRREPGSTLAVMLTLALGTGAATVTYAVVNHALLRPVPGVADEDRLLSVYPQVGATTPSRASISYDHFDTMRRRVTALAELAAWTRSDMPMSVVAGAPPRMATIVTVTRGFFDVLGVRPRIGRLFAAEEYEETGLNLLVISERLWRREFNADMSIVGRKMFLAGHAFDIIGVADDFQGIDRLAQEDGWLPRASRRVFDPTVTATEGGVVSMVGRLVPRASLTDAQGQLTAAFESVGESRIGEKTFRPYAFPGLSDGVGLTRSRIVALFRVMFVGISLLLVLACANAANLMFARHLRRRPELAVRQALGATRMRLLRELLVESAAMALGAAVIGLGFAIMLASLFRTSRLLSYLPALDDLTLDWRVVTFCAGVSALTILLFALVPAMFASRADCRGMMSAPERSTSRVGWLRTSLVATQVALSLTLTVSAALLAQSVHRLQAVDFGFEPDAVFSFSFRPGRAGYDDAVTGAAMLRLEERLEAIPAVSSAALAFMSPFGGASGGSLRMPGGAENEAIRITVHSVTADYFTVLGIPVLQGRTFSAAESRAVRADGAPIILNDALARRLFGSGPAVGRIVMTPRRTARGTAWLNRPVIGVVASVVGSDVRQGLAPFAYEPFGRQRIATVLIRPSGRFAGIARAVRQAVQEVAPGVPVEDIRALRWEADERISQERVLNRLSIVIGVLAVLLALSGLYAVVSQFVAERRRELAIRVAIGASAGAIAASILRRVGVMTAGGLVVGGAVLGPATGLLGTYLFGVSARDPVTVAGSMLGLMAASVAAASPAVHRAVNVDPARVLRGE